MHIEPFALERYFAEHEFSARHLLSPSDCESLSMAELLRLADPDSRELWLRLRLGYTETAGHPLLRAAIAELYPALGPESILVTAPEEAIFLSMHALLEPGDHVVCTFPGYQSLYEIARSKGCEVSLWRPEEASGWRFEVDSLRALVRNDTKLLVVNFPHNPTGYLPTLAEHAKLIDLARDMGAHLFSDEMYRFMEEDPAETLPAACERYDKAVSLFGLSKTFGLPGLRVGWLATSDRALLARAAGLRDYTTICNSAPSEILALMALRAKGEIVSLQRRRLKSNRAELDRFLAEHAEDFSWHRPRAGTIGLLRLLRDPSAAAFCSKLLAATGIMLVPSTLFEFGDQHVRIGFGRDDLAAGLELLGEHLGRARGTKR